jgi:hypothetical protein
LVTSVIAADACVTDTLQIAHEWAGDSQTDVPPQLRFGPSYQTWRYLLRRIDGPPAQPEKESEGERRS